MEQLISLLPIDVCTDSKHIYPRTIIEEAIKEFNGRVAKGVAGECSIPPVHDWGGEPSERYGSVDLQRVSHIVKHVWIDDGWLMCKVHLLGKFAELANELDIHYQGIPRATGTMTEEGVCTKYTLITVDLASPELV